jgi:hypothetical protein
LVVFQRSVVVTVSGAVTTGSRASIRLMARLPAVAASRMSCGVSISSMARLGAGARGTPSGAASVGSVSIAFWKASSPLSTSMCWMRVMSVISCTAKFARIAS